MAGFNIELSDDCNSSKRGRMALEIVAEGVVAQGTKLPHQLIDNLVPSLDDIGLTTGHWVRILALDKDSLQIPLVVGIAFTLLALLKVVHDPAAFEALAVADSGAPGSVDPDDVAGLDAKSDEIAETGPLEFVGVMAIPK